MACGSCGQARQTVDPGVAQAIASGDYKPPVYTVISPDGTRESFDRYIDAAVRRRQVNGQLTTHTSA